MIVWTKLVDKEWMKVNDDQLKEELEKEMNEPDSSLLRILDWSKNEHLKEASLEVSATKEEFEWTLPETPPKEKKKLPMFLTKKVKNDKGEYPIALKITFSVLLAISISLILGKAIIYFVSLGQEPVASVEVNGEIINEPEVVAAVNQGTEIYTIPELVTNVVQAGLFTTKEAADIEKKNLLAKNIQSTIVELNGKYALFIVIANSLEAAKSLTAQNLNGQSIEVFAKEIVIPAKSFELTEEQFVQVNAIYETFYYQLSMITTLANGVALNSSLQEEWKAVIDSFIVEDIPDRFMPLYTMFKDCYELVSDGTTLTKEEIVQQQQKLLVFLDLYQKIGQTE